MVTSKDKNVLGIGTLGDITKILHNQSVSDLSWLSVNEEDYRAAEALPKQNLDIIPELQKALSDEDPNGVPSIIPLRPHTIVNTNPEYASNLPPGSHNAVLNRVAKYVMANLPSNVIATRLQSEFSLPQLQSISTEAREIISQRGLLGNVYINPDYLPNCTQHNSDDQRFATSVTRRAPLILASSKCTGCACNASGMCTSLKKKIVSSIPYGPKLVATLQSRLAAEGRPISPISSNNENDWKEVIRSSFLKSPVSPRESPPQTIHTLNVEKPNVSDEQIQDFVHRKMADDGVDPMPSVQYLKSARRMMNGFDDTKALLSSQDDELRHLARLYGILGHTYLDMDALGGCTQTLDHILSSEDDKIPDFIIRRSAKCSRCKDVYDGSCAKLCKLSTILTRHPTLNTSHFASAIRRAVAQGRITVDQANAATSRISSIKNIANAVAATNLMNLTQSTEPIQYKGAKINLFHGNPSRGTEIKLMNEDEIRKTISHLMNTGLRGKSLQEAILRRYARGDLAQFPHLGSKFASNDGIQGYYYIDPTAYNDFGRGCDDGAKHFRRKGAPNVLAADSCTGCQLQTHPGWCSKYAKNLIRSIPSEVHMASKRSLPVLQMAPVENPVVKYELSSELSFDTNRPNPNNLEINFVNRTVDTSD